MRKEKTLGLDKKNITVVMRSLIVLGFYCFGDDSISEEVAGFSPFMVSRRKNTVFIVSCLIVVLVILSVKDPNNASLMLKT